MNGDPRALTEENMVSAFPPEDIAAERSRLLRQEEVSVKALQMMNEEGWPQLMEVVSERASEAYVGLRAATSMDRVAKAQGRLAELEWLLSLQALEETNLKTVRERLDSLEGG